MALKIEKTLHIHLCLISDHDIKVTRNENVSEKRAGHQIRVKKDLGSDGGEYFNDKKSNLQNAALWELNYFSVRLSAEIISLRTKVFQKGNVRKLLQRLFL